MANTNVARLPVAAPQPMSARERGDLCLIVRRNEKVAKTAAAQYSAQLRADFEKQLQTSYPWNTDKVWQEMHQLAQDATEEARRRVIERGKELGIHERFAPSMHVSWRAGGEQLCEKHHAALRRLAHSHIEAVEKQARFTIERESAEIQTEIMSAGITSDEGRKFLDRLPSIESLMPAADMGRLEAMLDTEIRQGRHGYDFGPYGGG